MSVIQISDYIKNQEKRTLAFKKSGKEGKKICNSYLKRIRREGINMKRVYPEDGSDYRARDFFQSSTRNFIHMFNGILSGIVLRIETFLHQRGLKKK